MATLRNHGWVRVGAVGSAAAVAAVLTLALLDGPAHAATTIITVTGLGDDAAPGVSCSPSSCPTLRDAVFTANAMTTNSTNPVEIDLPAGTITLTNGILTIGSTTNLNVTVKGATAGSPSGSTIDQTTTSSGVFVTPGLFANEVANFTDLTIEGGDAGGFGGGALQAGAASLSAAGEATTITDCAFLNNTATIGGAIAFSGGGDLTVVNSTFTNNSSTAGGGGGILYQVNSSATEGPSNLSISGSTFSGNSANSIVNGGADGGGVSFQGGGPAVGSLSITTSVFSGNSAGQSSAGSGQGGGLFVIDQNGSNVDSVALSTFVNNTANNGTVGNTIPQGQGGGVYSNAALFSLGDSRLVSNTATDGPSLWQGTSGVDDQSTATDDWWGVNTGPGANAATGGSAGSLTTSPWLQLRDLSSVGTVAPNGSTTFTADLLGLSTGGSLASGSLNGLASFPSSPGVFSNAVDGTPTSTSVQFVNGAATTAFAAGTTLGTNAGHIDAVADGQTTTGDVNVKANSTTSVSTSGTPSVFGQGVTFTATLSSQVTGTTPSLPQGGTVTFFIDAIPNSPVPVSNGSADLVVSNLNVGPHLVQALYSGDTDFNASSGLLAGNQTVNPSDTLTTVSSSLNPSAAGQSVTFSATVTAVAPGAGTPGGSVQFEDGGNPIGSPATLDGSGVASVSSSSLGVATHTITAVYGGSFDFNASTGTLSPDQVVNAAPTTLSLTSSVNSSVFGEGVSFTASVTATSSGTPGGSVQFGIDGADVGTTQTLVAGQASSDSITDLAVGTHTVTATYTPSDGVHASSSGTLAGGQAVVQANSTTLVSSDNNPSFPGAPVDFTATVTALSPGAGTPTGNVQFVIDGSNFGAVQSLSGGVATLSGVTSLGLGTHPVVADYLGDTNFVTSTSSALSQQVNGFATTTTVTSSLTPSVFGQPVSFTATVDAGANGTPTGSVQFGIDGANVGSAVTLSGGSASSADLSNLAVGTHVVTATYAPGTGFSPSGGTLPGGQTVNQAATTVVVGSSVNPSGVAQPVAFTATVTAAAPGGGTPTSQVQFFVDGSSIGTVSLTGGVATSAPDSSLAVGSHSVTATYTGDSDFTASSSATLTQAVNQISASFGVTSTAAPSVFGQPVQFVSTLTGPAGAPTGSVQFGVNGVNLGTPVSLVGGVATSTATSSLAVGDSAVTATYSGDTNYTPGSASLTQTVNEAGTSASIGSSLNPSTLLSPVTFTATVTAVAPGTGTPTGQVQFFALGSSLGTAALDGSGVATLPATSSLPVGADAVTATYLGDGNFSASTSATLTETVNALATSASLTTSVNPSVFGQGVTFTATVGAGAGNPTPTGDLQFGVDGANVGPAVPLDGAGAATSTVISSLAVGTHTVTATFLGSTDFLGSPATLAGGQTVDAASTTTTLTSAVNPSLPLSGVTFTATVAPVAPGAGTPNSGLVLFQFNGGPLGLVPVVNGVAVSAQTPNLLPGSFDVTATFEGSTDFLGSTSTLTQVVSQVTPAIGVSSTAEPSVFGQPVTFTATVAGTDGTPTGSVQFGTDGTNLGSPVTLVDGVATSTAISSLAVGDHTVTATYTGDVVYLLGAGSVTQTVGAAGSSTSVTSSVNASVFGQPVSFTATVAAGAPGAGTPAGQVQFLVDGSDFGPPVTLSAGSASSGDISSLAVGNHAVEADYLGSTDFAASTGTVSGGQTVSPSDSTVSVNSSANASVFGRAVQFTATVAAAPPGAGTPAGQVQFLIDGSDFGPPVTLSAGSASSGDISSLAVGNHAVEADYLGSGSFNASVGQLAGGQTVNQAATTTSIESSQDPSVSGTTVTFTATVAVVAPGAGTPDGTVQFAIDGSPAGSPAAVVNGVASYATSTLTVGVHTVSAAYSGSASFLPGPGILPGGQTVAAPAMADLQLRMFGPHQAVAWLPAIYTIEVTDLGLNSASGVSVVDTVPGSYSILKVVSFQGSCTTAASKVTCNLGDLGVHQTAFVAVIAVPTQRGEFTQSAAVTADQLDPDSANNTASITTRVHGFSYWLLGGDGGVFTFGDAGFYGSTGGMRLNQPSVAMVPTPDGLGYWLVASDGGVFTFGDAGFFGSAASSALHAPIVGMAPTPDGDGYWLVGADGSVYPFGDASSFGSEAGVAHSGHIVSIVVTPDGQGYWLAGSDGSVYAFGDAGSFGSEAGARLDGSIVGMAATPDGQGYWLVGSDGGVYAFGDAAFFGSLGGSHLNGPIVGIQATQDGQGYWLVGSDGGVFSYGDAAFLGGMGGQHLNKPMIGLGQ